jgi:large subunit ribosomal protein L21
MYAIVEIAGQQFKVETGKKIFVHRLEAEKESDLNFERVLLVEDEGKVIVGDPVVKDFIVAGHVIDHVKGDKVIVFKKKRKKGYRVKNGHRQSFTQIEITGIGEKGKIVKETPKKAREKALESVDEEVVAAEKKPAAKKASTKKAAEITEEAGKIKQRRLLQRKRPRKSRQPRNPQS